MYYKDMTFYQYGRNKENSLNIGWLEQGHPVPQGKVPQEFMIKLWKYLRYPVQVYRGFHSCDLCTPKNSRIPIVEYNGQKREVGFYEIRVWGKDGKVYVAPSLIFHYIMCHQYKPPQEFIDAVMDAEDPDSDGYYQKVLEYSEGDNFWISKDRTKVMPKLSLKKKQHNN